jgi:hypothetical protein
MVTSISNEKVETYSTTHKTKLEPDQTVLIPSRSQTRTVTMMSMMNLAITTLLLVSQFDLAESRLQLLRVDADADLRVTGMESRAGAQRRLDDAMANDSTYTSFSHVIGSIDGSMSMLDFSFSMKSSSSSPTLAPVTVTVPSPPSTFSALVPSSMPSSLLQNLPITPIQVMTSSSNPSANPVTSDAISSSPAAVVPVASPPPTSSPTSDSISAVVGSNDSRSSDTKHHSSIVSSTVIVAVAGLIGLAFFVLRRLQVVRNSSGSVSSGSVASNDFSIA